MFQFDDRVTVSRGGRVMTRRAVSRRPRAGRVVRLTATLSLLVAFISLFASVFLQGGNVPLSVRAVEWLRANGARGLVMQVEDWYYTLTAPAKGGKIKALPHQAGTTLAEKSSAAAKAAHALAAANAIPAPIKPVIKPALPGEGQWHQPFHERGLKYPPVLITSYRSNPAYPQIVAGVAWINTHETKIQYYPGVQEPSVNLPSRGPEMVPTSLRYKLLATFNSGFKLVDSGGGVVVGGHTYAPMKNGLSAFVGYRNGTVNIIDWKSGAVAGHNVVYARQNLPLIVNNGRPNPNLSDGPQWGATVGNAIMVWRSAAGITRNGDLIYAAGDYQTVASLAQIMIHAGAVRAMQLDINAEWPSFITYTGPNAAGPANLLPGMWQSPQRYLVPDNRDFYAVYLKPSDLAPPKRRSSSRTAG
ncbi:phosphodiester glycosidase family protein [Conexibacter sp. S30A1]|uniref:phosphodiester glycosidase family protein n=1 Tax=Conexibacter sp. S30A1 TaxID=2937800 RepID=UPI00200C1E16|nr:phosphodiester glycosidase family protein [Conexibacter sp. S30A1]